MVSSSFGGRPISTTPGHSMQDLSHLEFTKPVVACDCDEVLARFIATVLQFHNEKYGTQLKFEDFFSYNFSEVWGGTEEETFEKLDHFFDSHHFDNIPPIEEAAETLQRLSQKFDLVVVTARQNIVEPATRKWINRHFPGIFRDVLFGNHWSRANEPQISKADLCKQINAVALIDDAIGYILDAAPVVHRAILFNENDGYGWSRQDEAKLPSNAVKCLSWKDVEKELEDLYQQLTQAKKQLPN